MSKNGKIIGAHHQCGGDVKYFVTLSGLMSWRKCDKCGTSTKNGDAVFTKQEAAYWK